MRKTRTITIYSITNNKTQQRYIGATTLPLQKRWYLHKSLSRSSSSALAQAFKKYGFEAFSISALEVIPYTEDRKIVSRIHKWAKANDTYVNGYNDEAVLNRNFRPRKHKNLSKRAVLKPNQVRHIRSSKTACAKLAQKYGVSAVTIWNVRRGITYVNI